MDHEGHEGTKGTKKSTKYELLSFVPLICGGPFARRVRNGDEVKNGDGVSFSRHSMR
jgi:hypothetical protein